MNARIVFTGGGTAGHVTPNIPLIKEFSEEGWDVRYIGSAGSIEQTMIEKIGIPFTSIHSGKLRRYFSLKNFLDPFKIILGIGQAFLFFYRYKPDVVFSKGGFVAFPVVVGAWLHRIPIVAHESDMSPGLANKLSFRLLIKFVLPLALGKNILKNGIKLR